MSDFTPFDAADDEDVEAGVPTTEKDYLPFSMQAIPRLGLHMVNCKNVTVSLEVSNTGEAGEWRAIWGTNSTTGTSGNSVTFGSEPTNAHLTFFMPFKYGRIHASYPSSENRLYVKASRAL